MLNKIIPKKNVVLIILSAIFLALWSLTLFLGNREDKIMLLILSLIMPIVIYWFLRLMYRIIRINATPKVMSFFFYCFLIFGAISVILMIAEFIVGFPNGLTIALGVGEAIILATLDEAKKYYQANSGE